MKIYIKPIVALISGPILLSALLCQTAQASIIMVETNTAILADAFGSTSSPEAITIGYSVTENTVSDVYTYTYTVNNPAGDVLLTGPNVGKPEIVDLFAVDFGAAVPGAVIPGSILGGTAGKILGGDSVEWALLTPNVAAGTSSAPLSFQSLFAPTLGNASAMDANAPSPWDSYPDGEQVAVPNVPDSASTMTLLAGMMLLLPLRSSVKK
jgi:hypothetical protein